jgi:hypothetical protein
VTMPNRHYDNEFCFETFVSVREGSNSAILKMAVGGAIALALSGGHTARTTSAPLVLFPLSRHAHYNLRAVTTRAGIGMLSLPPCRYLSQCFCTPSLIAEILSED